MDTKAINAKLYEIMDKKEPRFKRYSGPTRYAIIQLMKAAYMEGLKTDPID